MNTPKPTHRIYLESTDESLQYLDCCKPDVRSFAYPSVSFIIVGTGPGAGRKYWMGLFIWEWPIEGGVVVMNSRTFPTERNVLPWKVIKVEELA
jgi:hypothetical protein